MKNIAVQGCILSITPGTGTIQISTLPSEKVKFAGKKAYFGSIQISVSNYTSSVVNVVGSGSGQGLLNPTAQKIKIEDKFAILEGDQTQITINGQAISGTSTIPISEIATVTIQGAGQSIGRGN